MLVLRPRLHPVAEGGLELVLGGTLQAMLSVYVGFGFLYPAHRLYFTNPIRRLKGLIQVLKD